MTRRLIIWAGGVLALILIGIFVFAYLLDEPLRRRVVKNINARLKGYTVRRRKIYFHPIGLSIDLENFLIFQNAYPHPPIPSIPSLHSSLHSKALPSRRVV